MRRCHPTLVALRRFRRAPAGGALALIAGLAAVACAGSLGAPERASALPRNGLIAYSVKTGCNLQQTICDFFVNTIRPDGTRKRRLRCSFGPERDCSDAVPRFSPNGRVLATATSPFLAFGNFLTLRRPGGAPIRTLKRTNTVIDFAWAPGGKRLAFNDSERIRLRNLRTGRTVRYRPTRGGLDVAWSRQGRLAWTSTLGDVVFISDRRQRTVKRVRLPIGSAIWPRWSPDGRWLVVLVGNGVQLIRADGRKIRPLRADCQGFEGEIDGLGTAVWSPDGREIACATRSSQLAVYNLRSRRQRIIASNVNPYTIDWQPLPRGG